MTKKKKENNNENEKKDLRFRDWVVVENNPKRTEQEFYDYLKTFDYIKYFVFQKEQGEKGTIHYQCYLEFSEPIRFNKLKEYLPRANINRRRGTKKQAREYAMKVEKYEDKAYTKIGKTYEWGTFVEHGERIDLKEIVSMIDSGASDNEIKAVYPSQFLMYNRHIQNLRDLKLKEKFDEFMINYRKDMKVYYIYGKPRTGKTRFVYDKHGYKNVYKAQGYQEGKWFDGYEGQEVLLLDEYRSNFDFGLLLQYTDGQPCGIQCRFKNKVACYTTVYIVSNIPLEQQHKDIQRDEPDSWNALLMRITAVYNFDISKDEPVTNKKDVTQLIAVDGENLPF